MGYVCTNCETKIEEMDPVGEKIICPMCSSRAVLKMRPPTANRVKAR